MQTGGDREILPEELAAAGIPDGESASEQRWLALVLLAKQTNAGTRLPPRHRPVHALVD